MSQYTHEDAWNDMKRWLSQGCAYMAKRENETIGDERRRIQRKLEGMRLCLDYMNETERLYFDEDTEEAVDQ